MYVCAYHPLLKGTRAHAQKNELIHNEDYVPLLVHTVTNLTPTKHAIG